MTRPAACSSKLENTHGPSRVLPRQLAVIRFVTQFNSLSEAITSCGDTETGEHLFALHFPRSFQVLNGLVNGLHQRVGPGNAPLQSLPVGEKSRDDFKLSAADDRLNSL